MRNLFCGFMVLILCIFISACSGKPGGASSSADTPSLPPPSETAPVSSAAQEPSDAQEEPSLPASSQPPLTRTITIPEGYTLPRIGMLLEDEGFCTAEEFIQASQTGGVDDLPLAAAMFGVENSCFKLEGILFPDTYEVYTGETPDAIVRMMITNTNQRLGEKLKAELTASPYSISEIFTLASIIEKEALGPEEMSNISSVLHNRLNNGMKLQCDVTINYVEGAIKPFITGDKNRFNSLYNTYKCKALPAGPICNPGLDAIKAALYPADTDYLYFLTDKNKNFLYAVTYEEHLQNVKTAGITIP